MNVTRTAVSKTMPSAEGATVLPPARPLTKTISRDGAKARRKTVDSLRAVAPLRENNSSLREHPSTTVSIALGKKQTRNALIQSVQAPAEIAPPTITLGRPASQVINDSRLKKLESTTITSTGAPLPVAVKSPLARSLSIDLTPIRVHTDARAQHTVRSFKTRAFAYGHHIFLGPGESPADLRLMAHEVAHVVQQSGGVVLQHFTPNSDDVYEREAEQASAAAVRGEKFTVRQRAGRRPQGLLGIDLGIPDPLDWLAGKANIIPGFRMLTIILGVNPINMSPVDRSAANILRAMIEFMPGGGLITQALDNNGVFEKAGAFVEEQINALGMTGSAIKAAVTEFIRTLNLPGDLLNPGAAWERAKRIFTEPIDRIKATAVNLVTGIIEIVKDAILRPIAKLAEGTEGYNLLKGVLGKDPITGDPVDRSAETLLGPLLKMIGLGDVWQKMQESKAIPRAWQWFQSTLSQLIGFVSEIPTLFLAAFKALTLEDIILVPKAFGKLAAVFGGFLSKFVSWGVDAMFKLLEIVFDVVSPGALGYVKKTGSAMKSIFQNPLPFVGNLIKAAKLGFTNFASNFLQHLKKGLIDWLTGSLQGVYIPKALTLVEFGKLALSVLGITWAQIRAKIVKALGPNGEVIMQGLELAFDIIKALITGGPAAAWEVIKDKLTGLRDQIVSGIISFVTETIVTKAIPKLIAMFIPGAGFISAIISIYDTVMVFVQKISKIIQVVTAFINSIVAIAQGNIGAAASKVESILGGLLSLAISFLAGFVGLGKVTDKIMGVVNKVRATVDKALDTAINFIIGKAKALFAGLFGKKKDGRPDTRSATQMQEDLRKGVAEADALLAKEDMAPEDVNKKLPGIKSKYRLTKLVIATDSKTEEEETDHIEGSVNPDEKGGKRKKAAKDGQTKIKISRSTFTVTTKWTLVQDFPEQHRKMVRGDRPPPLKKKLDRRHVISSQRMAEHYESVLNPTKWSGAQKILQGKGETVNAPLNNKKIQTVTQARHKTFFNDVKNLFIGDASINRSIGKETDIPDDWGDREWKKHLRYIKTTYALSGDFTA
jgi:uncharacterized protein DUF4157